MMEITIDPKFNPDLYDDTLGLYLLKGDCLERMNEIADQCVDMILADLPYGTTACAWDSVIPFAPLWSQYKRIIKPRGAIVLTASQPFTSALVMGNPKWFRYEWIWEKTRATGHLDANRRPLRAHESVLVFAPQQPLYRPQMATGRKHKRSGNRTPTECYRQHGSTPKSHSDSYYPRTVLRIPSESNGQGKLHPTQKPVALMEYLICTYTNEGEVVLDNVMGSGTTGIACANTNRRFIGIEKDTTYFWMARGRVVKAFKERKDKQ